MRPLINKCKYSETLSVPRCQALPVSLSVAHMLKLLNNGIVQASHISLVSTWFSRDKVKCVTSVVVYPLGT